jgi:hypothetical protein
VREKESSHQIWDSRGEGIEVRDDPHVRE